MVLSLTFLFLSLSLTYSLPTVPPGAPTSVTLVSSLPNSLEVKVQLSPDGSFPILEIVFNITSHKETRTHKTRWYQPGETVQLSLSGLEAGTEYRMIVYEVNYAGNGPESAEVVFSTGVFKLAGFR